MAGMASSPSRCCCPEGGETSSRDSTPLKRHGWLEFGEIEPPAAPVRRRVKPPLLKAIENGSIAQVRAVLELTRGDVGMQFLDSGHFETALCCAVRTGQTEEMVQTLLRYGADANEYSMEGRSALSYLCDTQPCRGDSAESKDMFAPTLGGAWLSPTCFFAGFDTVPVPTLSSNPLAEAGQLRVGTLLMAAGAHSDACDSTGATPAMLARKSGKQRLACLVEYYGIAQVMLVIGRVLVTPPTQHCMASPVRRISEGILRIICGFLAPEGSETTLLRIGALLRNRPPGSSPS